MVVGRDVLNRGEEGKKDNRVLKMYIPLIDFSHDNTEKKRKVFHMVAKSLVFLNFFYKFFWGG